MSEETVEPDGPPVVHFALRAWPNRARDLRPGDVVIVDPTWGVLRVQWVKVREPRVRLRVKPRGGKPYGLDLDADALAFRKPDDEEW